MIIFLIFAGHFIFWLYIFFKAKKEESLTAAFQNLIFVVIIFAVGWTLFTLLINIFVEPEGFGTLVIEKLWGDKDQIISFNRDTITLLLLSVGEFFFFKNFSKR
ncbi:MAG: hypothetical protein GXO87_01835 [Chlorobi bacterium]|nr:hypothetical protein [Chlorobiota bacterium]